ncbi:MAG: hypothetical protein KBD06_01465 [Candidatus Pacebacteria bacterium]|nr:hypothetical protein [Candidatus Paceibacterota bacterium]
MDLVGMDVRDKLRRLKLTVLYRPGGTWLAVEVGRIVNGLMTEASQHPKFPEHVILLGEFTKEATLNAILGGIAYTATTLTGIDHKDLPFRPQLI